MGNVQYRTTVWICRRLTNNRCSEEVCNAIELFREMMHDNHLCWGQYAVYVTWLNHHFTPNHGLAVFGYLKQHHPRHMYSFWYLVGHYYGFKIICFVCRSYRTWITGRCCPLCQSTQAVPTPSPKRTATTPELHPTQTETPTV